VKRKIALSISCLVLVLIAGVALLASNENGVVLTQDGLHAIANGPTHVTAAVNEDASLKTIAGNLSTYKFGTFFCCFGNTIAEGGSNFPFQTWVAIAFTPTADAKVTKIEESVGAFSGVTSGFELSLNDDSSGLPGAAIKTFHVAHPPTYGNCCTVDVGAPKAGIPVKKGTQYWVVASTTSKDTNFLGGWAFNSTDMRSHSAASWCMGPSQYCGNNSGKWVAFSGLLPGFAVLGN